MESLRVIFFICLKVFICYLVSWLVVYSLVMSFDYRYVTNYFYLSWFSPGEMPAFIQLVAFFSCFVLTLKYFLKAKS